MSFHRLATRPGLSVTALAFSALTFAANAHAAGDPRGIWYDHNGRGAVEIKNCAANPNRLCGHVVYVKKARNKKRCGMQIIGNVRSNGRGWIYSPKRGRSFPLAMKRLSDNRLRIVGNAGSFFTKTYIWKRAPDSIVNCGQAIVAEKKAVEPVAKPVATKTKPVAKSEPRIEPKVEAKAEQPAVEPTNTSSATAALIATTRIAAKEEPKPEPVVETAEAEAETDTVNDLAPPGGLSTGGDEKLGKLNDIVKKFTGGKGIKLSGKGRGKCKYRIPYVGRTINVPCK